MLRMGTAHPLVTGSILQSWETRHWHMSTHISSLVPLSSPSLAPASSLPCRRTLTKCEFSIINSTQEAGQILHRCSPQGKSGDLHKIAAPDPESYFNHRDHRHCFKGSLVGGMFLIASFISLGIYVTWTLQGVKEVFASMHFLLCFLLNLLIFALSVRLFLPLQSHQSPHDLHWNYYCCHWTCPDSGKYTSSSSPTAVRIILEL